MIKYRDWFITFGAVVCLVEFWAIGRMPSASHVQLVGILHLVASLILLISLALYVSMWRVGWVLVLRVIFACFIVFMMISSFKEGINLLGGV